MTAFHWYYLYQYDYSKGAFIHVAAFFLMIERSTPISISELSQSEIWAYNLKMFLKSVGGAASYCFIPMILSFWLADSFTDEIILENKQ